MPFSLFGHCGGIILGGFFLFILSFGLWLFFGGFCFLVCVGFFFVVSFLFFVFFLFKSNWSLEGVPGRPGQNQLIPDENKS